jgi:superfamily II DNA or RNA helicase
MSLNKFLTKKGYIITKDSIDKKIETQIIKDLTVIPKVLQCYQSFAKPKKYKIFQTSSKCYYLPRYYATELFGDPLRLSLPPGLDIKAKCLIGHLPHQNNAILKMDELFKPNLQLGIGGVLSLPCGLGKTYLAIRKACLIGKRTMVIVNKECLMDQWVEAIKKFTNATVGIVQRDKNEVDNDFVIAMIHSLCQRTYPQGTFDSIGFTIYDEVHHLSSMTFCKAMMKVRTRYTLGLSATPERRDGLSHVFYKFLGPLFHKEKRQGMNQVAIKQISITSTSTHYQELYMKNGIRNTAGMATQISQFPERNSALVKVLKLLVEQGRKILVLSSRRDHLHDLKDRLDDSNLKLPNGKYATYGFYYGKQGTNKKIHKKMLDETAKCDIILGTDAIAKEGLDISALNTLILSTPSGTDVEQAVGRILRKYHKDTYPMVVDFVDTTGNFQKHSKERLKWYKGEKYDIQNLKIQIYDDPKLNKYSNRLTKYLSSRKFMKGLSEKEQLPISEEPNLDTCFLGSPKKQINIVPKKLAIKKFEPKKVVLKKFVPKKVVLKKFVPKKVVLKKFIAKKLNTIKNTFVNGPSKCQL